MKKLVCTTILLLLFIALCGTWATAQDNKGPGCPFSRVSPVPANKAVIYIIFRYYSLEKPDNYITVPITDVTPGRLNPQSHKLEFMQRGYHMLVVEPGTYRVQEKLTITVEAGKEYFLRNSYPYKFKLTKDEDIRKDKDMKNVGRAVPFRDLPAKTFNSVEELESDPFIKDLRTYDISFIEPLNQFKNLRGGRIENFERRLLFQVKLSHAEIRLTLKANEFGREVAELKYIQKGFALDCDRPPFIK